MTIPEGFTEIPNKSPYFAHLGPFYSKKAGDKFVVGLQTNIKHLRGGGFVAGGVLFTLADFGMGSAVAMTMWPEFEDMKANQIRLVTISLNVDCISSPPIDSWIEAEIDVIKTGKNVCFAQCIIRNGEQILTRANANFIVRQ